MKLQIAFDLVDLDKSLKIAHQVEPYCDIFEIGTILLYKYGFHAIEKFRAEFAQKTLLVDTKIIDQSEPIVQLLAEAGADWITAMGGTSREVIHSICKEANKHNLKIAVDLLDASSPAQIALEAENLGATALLFHQPYNEETSLIFLDKWQMIKGNASLPLFISARINRKNIHNIISLNPHAVVIGRSIVQAEDPVAQAQFYYDLISKG